MDRFYESSYVPRNIGNMIQSFIFNANTFLGVNIKFITFEEVNILHLHSQNFNFKKNKNE